MIISNKIFIFLFCALLDWIASLFSGMNEKTDGDQSFVIQDIISLTG